MPAWELPKEIEAVIETLRIREENGYDVPSDLFTFKVQMSKSALLNRLLSGKLPFPFPPPTSFSYPWYELLENGFGYPYDVSKAPSPGRMVIDQRFWNIVEELDDNEYIVTYDCKGKPAPTKWHLYTIGCELKTKFNQSRPGIAYLWKLELITEDNALT